MSTDPPNDPWGSPPGGYPPPPPPSYPPPPPPSYPGGGYPGGGYPGGGYTGGPGGGYPGSNRFRNQPQSQFGPLAGWWRRVAATLLDSLIVAIPGGLIVGLAGMNRITGDLVIAAINLVYVVVQMGSPSGATLGMKAVGNRAVDVATGQSIGYTRALVRTLVTILISVLAVISPFIALIGLLNYLWPLWDSQNQALHDKVAKSLVIRVDTRSYS